MPCGQAEFKRIESALNNCEDRVDHPSKAPLFWVLTHVYQMDESEAQDAICDGSNDKGIDAIVIREFEGDREIVVIQSERRSKPADAGDSKIKELSGSMDQLSSPAGIRSMIESAANEDLSRLLMRLDVARLIEDGYRVSGLFVTNAKRDRNLDGYLRSIEGTKSIEVFDSDRMIELLDTIERPGMVEGPVSFHVNKADYLKSRIDDDMEMVVALVSARDIALLPGIADGSLFAYNVRYGLGRTKINKSIERTLQDRAEHAELPAYHNGLTVVCEGLDYGRGRIRVDRLSVVNGCQSVIAIKNNEGFLTDEARVVVKLIGISEGANADKIADTIGKITTRSNNQNGVVVRDLRSNDEKQRALAREIEELADGRFVYLYKKGVSVPRGLIALDNAKVAQQLASLFGRKPWIAHSVQRLFDEDYAQVFGPDIHGAHVLFADALFNLIRNERLRINNPSVAAYQLTYNVLLYSVGEVLRSTEDGAKLLSDPSPCIAELFEEGSDLVERLRVIVQCAVVKLICR